MDTTTTPNHKKNNNKIYFLLFVVLALFSTNAILFFKNKKANEEVVKLGDDKTRMQTEIDKIEAELDKANNDYTVLNEQMQQDQAAAREKIAQLREALRKGELTEKELALAQEDVKQLRYFVSKYVTDIDELKKLNASLTTERDSLITTVTTVNERASSLEKQNRDLDRKVKAAAALKTASILITPVRIKSSGKETSVSKAATAQKLKIDFKLLSNDLSEKGLHNIYVRVIDPKGNLLSPDSEVTSLANGEELKASYKTAIEFANDSRVYSISWANPAAFSKGVYTIALYADGFNIGTAKTTLK